jgi:hypothetical protein
MATKVEIKVATETWIAAALLHREHPSKQDFTVQEILERAKKEAMHARLRPGVYVHVVQHCVANRAPNPGRYRMLFETANGRRRLFRKGDSYHPDREGSKITPERQELPTEYADLLDWYHTWEGKFGEQRGGDDPLMKLSGSGKELWADEPADEYVERLRQGWQ